jgi:hypothetical protein
LSTEAPKEKRRAFFRYAFHNVYNYTALLGVGAAAALTGNWWLGIVGGAVEGLWMLFAPDSKLLGKVVWEKRWNAEEEKRQAQKRKKQLASLGPGDWKRCQAMADKRAEIERLAQDNPTFTQELMESELRKLGKLSDDFVDLAVTSARFETYMAAVNFDELERQMRRFEAQIEHARTSSDRELAQKNLDVLLRRKRTLTEIQQYIRAARGQLDLMENSFRLLADQIVTMRSPGEMSGQLDELMDGVEAVRTTARETSQILQLDHMQGVGKYRG